MHSHCVVPPPPPPLQNQNAYFGSDFASAVAGLSRSRGSLVCFASEPIHHQIYNTRDVPIIITEAKVPCTCFGPGNYFYLFEFRHCVSRVVHIHVYIHVIAVRMRHRAKIRQNSTNDVAHRAMRYMYLVRVRFDARGIDDVLCVFD